MCQQLSEFLVMLAFTGGSDLLLSAEPQASLIPCFVILHYMYIIIVPLFLDASQFN